jgi:hypothetical protein
VLRCLLSPFGLKFASGEPHRVTEITVAQVPALELGPTFGSRLTDYVVAELLRDITKAQSSVFFLRGPLQVITG